MSNETTPTPPRADQAAPETRKVRFRIRQGGMTVASAEGTNAEFEIWRYAHQYRAEGEVTIQHNAEGHWKRFALLCQWPLKGGAA